jgi:hypothetical protein
VRLYYAKITAAAAASSAAAGYPASNVTREEIDRPWLSVGLGLSTVTLTWPAATNVAAVLLEDVNFAAATIYRSVDAVAFTNPTAIAIVADKHIGRRRGLLRVNVAGLRGIRVEIAAGASTDGAAAWRIGAAYPFSAETLLTRNFDNGAQIRSAIPKVSRDLANGRSAQAATGSEFLELMLPFDRKYDQDVQEITRRARAGTVGLALEDPLYTEFSLPLRHVGTTQTESLSKFSRSEVSLELRERV